MSVIKSVNLAFAFLLELCALAALGYWGFHAGSRLVVKIILAIGAPLLAALVWGTFAAPRATVHLPGPGRLAVELAVFGCAVAGLYVAGRAPLAWALAVAFVINLVLLTVWKQ